ncbi:MAG: sensor histidine kinase [Acidimicrobiia bacterium]
MREVWLARFRSAAWSGGAVAVLALAAFAMLLSGAEATQRLVGQARVLQRAEAVLGAAAVARAAVGEALVLAEAEELGVADPEASDHAPEGAYRALEGLEDRLEELDAVAPDPEAGTFLATATEVLDLLGTGELEAGREAAQASLDPAYQALVEEVALHRDQAAAMVEASRSSAGRLALLARFVVAFALPVAATLAYWELMRRRVRQAELETLLEAERDLSRAKDEFIANVSHELRTPLTSIVGFSRVLEEQGFDDPVTALDLTNLIISESSELSRMVDDLLTAGRADAGVLSFEIEEVDVRETLKEVVTPFNRSGPRVRVACPPVSVRADPLRLRQVLRNLISNTRRHGGPQVTVNGEAHDGWFVCTVADNGRGVPAHLEDRLFERFNHVGKEVLFARGIGLGLSIARILTEAMGGTLNYERRAEETRFVVRLPLASVEGPAPVGEGPPAKRHVHLLADQSLGRLGEMELSRRRHT